MTAMAGALPSAIFGFVAALLWRDQSRDRAEQEAVRSEGVGKSRLGGSVYRRLIARDSEPLLTRNNMVRLCTCQNDTDSLGVN